MIAMSVRDLSQINIVPSRILWIQSPIFKEEKEPLQADEWLNTIEQKFHLLRVTEGMKASYAGHQLQGPAGIW
jgi:hypothetical protein